MDSKKTNIVQTYSRKISHEKTNLIVFYDGHATLKESLWTINGFLNSDEYLIQEVIFMQGENKKHDSFHVWYKNVTD